MKHIGFKHQMESKQNSDKIKLKEKGIGGLPSTLIIKHFLEFLYYTFLFKSFQS
jgi:hypothetical protein